MLGSNAFPGDGGYTSRPLISAFERKKSDTTDQSVSSMGFPKAYIIQIEIPPRWWPALAVHEKRNSDRILLRVFLITYSPSERLRIRAKRVKLKRVAHTVRPQTFDDRALYVMVSRHESPCAPHAATRAVHQWQNPVGGCLLLIPPTITSRA
jgi:hypothetical protein